MLLIQRYLSLLLAISILAACTARPEATATQPAAPPVQAAPAPTLAPPLQPDAQGISLPPGLVAEPYATGLRFPTALAFGPDGKLYLTQLNGAENGGTGQVVRIDGAGATASVLLDNLTKPTGLAWRDDQLYIVAGREVLRAGRTDDGLTPPVAVVQDLPFNGRSEGQIKLLPDGRLLFAASGTIGDVESGRLLALDRNEQVAVVATGLKNAYAQAVDPTTGQLYSTEIGDDPVDGSAPPEEVNRVEPGADYGWPLCYGAALPVRDRGATATSCAATKPATITFGPHSTPTGLAFSADDAFPPAYQDSLFVALWNGTPPEILAVPRSQLATTPAPTPLPFMRGLERPIDLLPDPRGGLLVLDYAAGTVLRVVGTGR